MKTLETVNWGIIGVGDVCEVKSGPAFSKIPHSNLVAVMRRNGDLAKDYARRHNVPMWFDDAAALIHHPDINAIYIATPPHMHLHYTELAAKAGKPVYVEKPMARTYEECKAMTNICKQYDLPLFVAYYRRMLPHYLYVKSLIDDQVIGDIRYVQIQLIQSINENDLDPGKLEKNWRIDPDIAGGGYFYDLASHQLDYLDYLLGPIHQVRGLHSNQAGLYSAEDIVSGHFGWNQNIIGQGIWCFTASKNAQKDVTTIVGSKGSISFSYFSTTEVILTSENGEVSRKSFDQPQHIQQPLIETIVDELRGKGQCPSTGESATRTNRVMEDLLKQGLHFNQ
ncbi:Gfo/Idh/MocA family protein [Membranihabitans marinus]|uniref:Gfo/Idh/MocA family protein n=1 Tax=Membranihabitans marinus TaxID=1227546 RepID=UPI001F434E06|nr:Gfo/Idh/MocA family oxidoreductase [Membranihabitans marinus]